MNLLLNYRRYTALEFTQMSAPLARPGKGYKAFGSFMVEESPETLITRANADYTPPPRPVSEADCACYGSELATGRPPPFGAAFRPLFYVCPEWTFLNTGAFGGVARASLIAAHRWAEHVETQPLRFMDRELFPLLVESTRQLAAELHCPPSELTLIPNATYGLTAVIDSVPLSAGDVVFMLDIGYGSVRTMLQRATKRARAVLEIGDTHFATIHSSADFIAQFAAALPPASAGPLRLVVIDHVASNTGVVLPVAEMAALARARGARVLVDGAHALGSLEVDLTGLGAAGVDYYVTNAHKWLGSARGVAALHVGPGAPPVRSPIVSHGYGRGFTSEFMWDGARDYTPAVALPVLLAWWRWVGVAEARAYCRGLLSEAVALLVAAWGTRTHAPCELYSHMACVELPAAALPPGAVRGGTGAAASDPGPLVSTCSATHGKQQQEALYRRHIECPVKVLPGPAAAAPCADGSCGGPGTAAAGQDLRAYVRISAYVFNERADYERLAAAVLELTGEGAWAESTPSAAKSDP